jgi:L-ascorbate metabolism protein UlaG (beta-lactamase superfamily)
MILGLPRLVLSGFALGASFVCAASGQNPPDEKHVQVSLEYMGAAGWRITDGAIVILIDPYLSRIIGPPPPGRPFPSVPGDTRLVYGWDDVAVPDVSTIDVHVKRADFILVTHTHYDHVLDVPHIALKTGATVIGTESTGNVLRAYDVPEKQLITVRGGEDYDFGSFSLKVIPSLHSPLDHKHLFSSATAPAGMKAPLTLRQMHPEGGTLAYLVRFHAHQILVFGGMNYIEREIEGLRPDVVLAGAGASRTEIFDYTGRLMRDLGFPPLVLPTHWDNFLVPYEVSQQDSVQALQSFVREVKAASSKTTVIVPKYFQTIPLYRAKW